MAIQIIMRKQGQSVESCILNKWFVKKGQHVKIGDILFTYETDKASFDEESPADGIILEIFHTDGDEVPVLATVAIIGKEGENIECFMPQSNDSNLKNDNEKHSASSTVTVLNDKVTDNTPIQISEDKIRISPRAKKLAEKMNINYLSIKGSGPEGRIIVNDIEIYNLTVGSKKTISVSENDFDINKITNIRRIIARKMLDSLQNSAQLTHHISADARKLLYYRKKIKKLHEESKIANITINDIISYAVIKALKAKPEINSHFLGDSIKTFKKVHLGFAVHTERGLMVPVLRNADDFTIEELSIQLNTLSKSCKSGNINPELLESNSASFTVSNLGSYYIEMFTPIINLPQSGILGVNTIVQRPSDIGNGNIGLIPYIGLSLTYDHRVIDGAPASAFLKEVKEQIEKLEFNF